jgi:adenosylcobyric acid synthase
VEFVTSNIHLERFDLVILPGSKLTLNDLAWLKETGLFKQLQQHKKPIFGICGGYEMMFKKLDDEEGLGFIDDVIVFQKEKVLEKKTYSIFDVDLEGFEIHHGVANIHTLSYHDNHIQGTFVHGVFDSDAFREKIFKGLNPAYIGYDFQKYKDETIEDFIHQMKKRLNVERILHAINS